MRKKLRDCKKMNPNVSKQAIISKICHGLLPNIRKEILHRDIETTEKLRKNLQQIQKNFQRSKDDNSDVINEIKALHEEIIKTKMTNETKATQNDEKVNHIQERTEYQQEQFYPNEREPHGRNTHIPQTSQRSLLAHIATRCH